MRDFQELVGEGKVKKIAPDRELAQSLLKNIEEREKSTLKLTEEEFSLLVFENLYDCLRELMDVILALEGYKSYSHEAGIIYLKHFNIPENVLFELDRFRVKRNNSKYYGKPPSVEDAKGIKNLYLKLKRDLLVVINQKLK